MNSAARTVDYRPRGSFPPVVVECTNPGCGLRFLSGARSHTRCPECGRNLRVHRSAQAQRTSRPARQTPAAAVRQAAEPVRHGPPVPRFPLPPPPAPELADDDDDDGYSYVVNAAGRLVLAEHAAGQLMAAARLPAAYVARELRARAWDLRPHGPGLCQVIAWHPAVVRGEPGWWEACQGSTAHEEPAVCAKHWAALRTPYAWANGHR